jgi:hypothetical protein
MALDRDRLSYPEDFLIGPLGGAATGKKDDDAAYAAAAAFLAAAVDGKVEAQRLSADARDRVAEAFDFASERGYAPRSFRLGVPKDLSGGQVALNVRFFAGDGASEGEIYMAGEGTQWVVADVQVNFADLATARAARKDRFFPSDYRWLLEE